MLLDNIWRAPGPCNFFHMTEHTQRPGCAIIIFLSGTWLLLDPRIRVYLGYLSVRQRYLLPLTFCFCYKRPSGWECPSLWAGAPIDFARCIWALDPGLLLIWKSSDDPGSCGTSTVLARSLQPNPLPGIQQPIKMLTSLISSDMKSCAVRLPLSGWLEQRARVEERDIQGGARRSWEPGACDVGWRHHHRSKGCILAKPFLKLSTTFQWNHTISKESAHFGFYALEQDTEVNIPWYKMHAPNLFLKVKYI